LQFAGAGRLNFVNSFSGFLVFQQKYIKEIEEERADALIRWLE
jgi:hypothetical protein